MQATVNSVRQTECSFSLAKFLHIAPLLAISDVTCARSKTIQLAI